MKILHKLFVSAYSRRYAPFLSPVAAPVNAATTDCTPYAILCRISGFWTQQDIIVLLLVIVGYCFLF